MEPSNVPCGSLVDLFRNDRADTALGPGAAAPGQPAAFASRGFFIHWAMTGGVSLDFLLRLALFRGIISGVVEVELRLVFFYCRS